MLTFLTIENKEHKGFLPLRYKIFTELKSSEGLDIKHIRYIHRKGRIHWDKIKRLAGDEKCRLLTCESLALPPEQELWRFDSTELKSRLCVNMAIATLKNLKKLNAKARVAVFDPEAQIADCAHIILRYTQSLTVVTRMTGIYSAEAERILSESGAVLNVSKRLMSIEGTDLVIAPTKLNLLLPLNKTSVILTVAQPAVSQRCGVYYKYYFTLSEELLKLLPQGFDAEYFASALYTLLGRYDLGSLVPQATKGDSSAHTLVSLAKYLMNIGLNP